MSLTSLTEWPPQAALLPIQPPQGQALPIGYTSTPAGHILVLMDTSGRHFRSASTFRTLQLLETYANALSIHSP